MLKRLNLCGSGEPGLLVLKTILLRRRQFLPVAAVLLLPGQARRASRFNEELSNVCSVVDGYPVWQPSGDPIWRTWRSRLLSTWV
jgi:hypothetical protein